MQPASNNTIDFIKNILDQEKADYEIVEDDKTLISAKEGASRYQISLNESAPTFILRQEFEGSLPKTKKPITLYHLDIYRSKNFKEIAHLGLDDFLGKKNTITLIEWADKIKKHLPKSTIYIYFTS